MTAEAAEAVAELVRATAANRRALLRFGGLFPALAQTVKDPWRTDAPGIKPRAAVKGLPTAELVSVRLDPTLDVQLASDGPIGRSQLEGEVLRFIRGRQETARVRGPEARLRLVVDLVAGRSLMPAALVALLLPRDLDAFEARLAGTRLEVAELLDEGRILVEAIELLVCRLYDVPPDLEEAVLAHAAARARKGPAFSE